MRRLLAAAALTAVVLTGAACSSSDTDTSASATTSAAATTAAAAGSGNTQEICTTTQQEFEALGTQVTQVLSANLMTDPDKALASLKELIAQGATLIRAQAARATDAELKALMLQYADTMEANFAKVKTVADLQNIDAIMTSAEAAELQSKLDKFCPDPTAAPSASAS